MFREMLRKKQALTEPECKEILINEKRGVLSVIGDEGYPYGFPINHYYNKKDAVSIFTAEKSAISSMPLKTAVRSHSAFTIRAIKKTVFGRLILRAS